MRSIRMIGLAAIAAMAAMACVGASSASATNTQICKVHSGLSCPEGQATTSVHMLNEDVSRLLNSQTTVLCLTTLSEATPLALGNPQAVHVSALEFASCGTSAEHTNCEVEVEELPLGNLLKTGLDEGLLSITNGQARVICENVFGVIDIDCKYNSTGNLFLVSGQHFTASETPATAVGDKSLCPDSSTFDGLLKTLNATSASTSLCKTHTTPCPEKDQTKGLHVVTTKPPVFYNTVANIECESSLGSMTILSPGYPQKLHVTQLTWKECHTQGAADNCTVTSKTLPTLDLQRAALNLGTATTLGLKVGIDCTVLGLIELDCVYGNDVTLQVEGALHKEGTGHGMFTASKVVLNKLEGSGHCPELVKWDALYEPSGHVYIIGSSASGDAYILG